ncbi:MAG: hypothetical protein IKB87_05150 [Clostridia bacterium]|nr:hypothetical protein [Clostridia bacterium]
MNKILKSALISLAFNIAFGAYHIVFGVMGHSWWLFTVGVYYVILSTARFTVIMTKRNGRFITKFTGIMLMVLSVPLAGTVVLAVVADKGTVFHEIIMIALAVYAFTKITHATVKLVKSRHIRSAKAVTLRNISFTTAFVSIFSLQRSMLVSFEGMTEAGIRIMNAATGSGVCIIVFWLGFNLVRKEKIRLRSLNDRTISEHR